MNPEYLRQFIYRSIDLKPKILSLPQNQINYDFIHQAIAKKENLPQECFYILINGKKCSNESFQLDRFHHDTWLDVCLSIAGGKGGFGSMLRAIGAQIEKTTNKEACRDLSGRRLRDVNAEKRFKEWTVRKAKEKMQKEKKRKDKLKELNIEPKIVFSDDQYFKDREEIPELVDDALEYGLKVKQEDKSQNKEIILDTKNAKKSRHNLWLGLDMESEEDENTE